MLIKLVRFNIASYNNFIGCGQQVCPCNGASSVGTIVDISKKKHDDGWRDKKLPATVTVLWGTGKKRGKRTEHPPENLADFTKYLATINIEYNALIELQNEAQTLGM